MVDLWLETVDEIGEASFDAALRTVLKQSPFRPAISEIRKAAGLVTEEKRVEEESLSSLGDIIAAIRTHTHKLKAIPGKVIRDRDDDGRMLDRRDWEREPENPAPVFSTRVEAAVLLMGYGDRQTGLDAISEHPALYAYWKERGEELPNLGFVEKNTKDIEARWLKWYVIAGRRIAVPAR